MNAIIKSILAKMKRRPVVIVRTYQRRDSKTIRAFESKTAQLARELGVANPLHSGGPK